MLNWLRRFETNRKFSSKEAWQIYRLIALAETLGWTLLISALFIRHYHLAWSAAIIIVAGQIHGTIFVTYFIVLLAAYPSLRWSRIKLLFATLAGILPYGSLLFEIYASRTQKHPQQNKHAFYALIQHNGLILAAQPRNGTSWQLPKIKDVGKNSSLIRVGQSINRQFGIDAKIKQLEHNYYEVINPGAFKQLNLSKLLAKDSLVDDYAWLSAEEEPGLHKTAAKLRG